jgi:hypothetical protein
MAKRTIIDHKLGYKHEFATEDDKVIYHTTQDVQPILEHVKQLSYNKPGKDLRHEGWAKDQKAWKKWLNNPDNKLFRTWKGKV